MTEFEFQADVRPRPRVSQRKLKKDARRNFPPVLMLLVLAHQIDRIIAEGRATTLANIAQQIGVSSARLSQIRRFTKLAPAIQEQIIRNDPTEIGVLSERQIMMVLLTAYQTRQVELFERIVSGTRTQE